MMAPRGVVSWTLPSSGWPDDRNDDADETQRLGTVHDDVRHQQHVQEITAVRGVRVKLKEFTRPLAKLMVWLFT